MTTKKFKPAAVLSAYTDYLLGDFSEMHEYIEHVLRRPVFTHEMAIEAFGYELRQAIKSSGDLDAAILTINELGRTI